MVSYRHIPTHKIAHLSAIFVLVLCTLVYSLFYFSNTRAENVVFHFFIQSQSECFNGLDDDADNLVDSADPDCLGPADIREGMEYDGEVLEYLRVFPESLKIHHSPTLGTYIQFTL